MPPSEVRALLLLLALAVAGQGVRHLVTRPGEPPGQVELLSTLSAGSPVSQRDSARSQARPLQSGELIDVDRGSATELARLPKVGPRLAKVIVANREAHGPFRDLAGLDRVDGIGPRLLKLLTPHVTFSAVGLPRVPPSGPVPLNLNRASLVELDALPGIGPSKAAAILRYREQHGLFGSVDELERVPGFGAAAVARLRNMLAAP